MNSVTQVYIGIIGCQVLKIGKVKILITFYLYAVDICNEDIYLTKEDKKKTVTQISVVANTKMLSEKKKINRKIFKKK